MLTSKEPNSLNLNIRKLQFKGNKGKRNTKNKNGNHKESEQDKKEILAESKEKDEIKI